MPSIARSQPERTLTVFTVSGAVGARELLDAIIPFLTEAPTPRVLWDLSGGTLSSISAHDLERVVAEGVRYADARRGGRTALLSPRDVDYGLSRMFQAFVEMYHTPFELQVFRDRDEAVTWLAQLGDPAPVGGG